MRPRGAVSRDSPIGDGAARAGAWASRRAHAAGSSDCPRRSWGFASSGGSAWAAKAPPSHSQRSIGSYGIFFLSLLTTAEKPLCCQPSGAGAAQDGCSASLL